MNDVCTARVVITGLGAITAAGAGAGPLWEGLLQGRSFLTDIGQPWASPPFHLAARVAEVGARERIPARRLRRLGRTSQLAVLAALEAAEQAGLLGREQTGVVLGTGLGALDQTVEFLAQLQDGPPQEANPSLFPSTVMNAATAHVSMELGFRGYSTTVNQKEISAEMAVQVAVDAIRLGHVEALLAGGVEELSSSVHHGYRRFGALTRERPRPYRQGRDGLALGEGACLLALESSEHARQRGARILAEVAGVGAAGGDRPLVSWGSVAGPAGVSSIDAGVRAIRDALAEAQVDPAGVDLVVGCGCGSLELDRLEALVLREVFEDRPVPVTSPHGGLGTWMASGALRLVSAVQALEKGSCYPTLTEGEPDAAAPVPGLVTAPWPGTLRTALVCSHATGGGSSALVLIKGQP